MKNKENTPITVESRWYEPSSLNDCSEYGICLFLGKIDGYQNGRKQCMCRVEMRLSTPASEEVNKDTILSKSRAGRAWYASFMGSVSNPRNTNWIHGGQIIDTITEHFTSPKVKELLRWWRNYHLNNMRPGTPEQMRFIKDHESEHHNDYDKECEMLKEAGLYEVELPNGNKYKYGHSWLYEPILGEDLEHILDFIGKADGKMPWLNK